MFDFNAIAFRFNGSVTVTMIGNLPDTCCEASVEDFYPGGNRRYTKDPGRAEIFLRETRNPNPFCLQVLVPWQANVTLIDDEHDTVCIFLNGHLVKTLSIRNVPDPSIFWNSDTEASLDRTLFLALDSPSVEVGEQFVVIQRIEGDGCKVIPAFVLYPQIYRQAFGPSSRSDCQAWMAANCAS